MRSQRSPAQPRAGRAVVAPTPRHLAQCLAGTAGLVLTATAALAILAMATYDPGDPLFRVTEVANRAGVVGAALAGAIHWAVGWGGGAILVGSLAVIGVQLMLRDAPSARFCWGATALFLVATTVPALLFATTLGAGSPVAGFPSELWASGSTARGPGGWFGAELAAVEQLWLSHGGALVLNGVFAATGVAALLQTRLGAAVIGLARGLWRVFGAAAAALGTGFSALGAARRRRCAARRARRSAARHREASTAQTGSEPHIVDHRGAVPQRRPPERRPPRRSLDKYAHPALEIFRRANEPARQADRDGLLHNARVVEKKLADFGVHGRVVTVHPGPVITMYEFAPASGIKVGRITSLSDDLALALRALSVRIIAPLPGKSVVGIEVPNAERDSVLIRDVLEASSPGGTPPARLPFALGKDIFGAAVAGDLAAMPHLLVAGATGTGKSVFLNALLCSLLFRTAPSRLKLLLIDPKILELSIYEGIPHLIADVVTHPKRAAAALAGVVQKMEERYQLMAALGARNIEQFNERLVARAAAGEAPPPLPPGVAAGQDAASSRPSLTPLPYIVVVIDELADLMVVSARDVEESLQRLAQMARAAGIHLVLATQRPSVDVLTGVIKANFPSRISFQVSSRTDSRTILDHNGAEHLLGRGDMLFLPPGTSKLQRIHGAYVSEAEVTALVAHLRAQGAPEFDPALLQGGEGEDNGGGADSATDELYDRALAIVAETRNASISYLQRRLKVGYNRAARMVEQMECDGLVGRHGGTKPREVYMPPPLE